MTRLGTFIFIKNRPYMYINIYIYIFQNDINEFFVELKKL